MYANDDDDDDYGQNKYIFKLITDEIYECEYFSCL